MCRERPQTAHTGVVLAVGVTPEQCLEYAEKLRTTRTLQALCVVVVGLFLVWLIPRVIR